MKCFNCGRDSEKYLCIDCQSEEILDKIFKEIRFYNAETCANPYIVQYVSTISEERGERNCIPDILSLFPIEITEFYQCVYYWMQNMVEFEEAANEYLDKHSWEDEKSQLLISYLLKKYIRHDFIKPGVFCDWIAKATNVSSELYLYAATYYAMIAEYDLSDLMADKALNCEKFLYSDKDYMLKKILEQKEDTKRYRTKKPYWPSTEEGRIAVAEFYDKKGIGYSRIESKPKKIPESEFEQIEECLTSPKEYCAFWCSEAYNVSGAKPIYQIAAVKVVDGIIQNEFQSFIKPWDSKLSIKAAADEAGVELSVIENAEYVDQVMRKFFDFVGDFVLLSTDALDSQAILLSRAARYTGMKKIPNKLYDLSDMAAKADSKYKFADRAVILNDFNIEEGKNALSKANANIKLYEALLNYGK